MRSFTALCAPVPSATIAITAATPITMPSIVSSERSLLARSAPSATRMISPMSMDVSRWIATSDHGPRAAATTAATTTTAAATAGHRTAAAARHRRPRHRRRPRRRPPAAGSCPARRSAADAILVLLALRLERGGGEHRDLLAFLDAADTSV